MVLIAIDRDWVRISVIAGKRVDGFIMNCLRLLKRCYTVAKFIPIIFVTLVSM